MISHFVFQWSMFYVFMFLFISLVKNQSLKYSVAKMIYHKGAWRAPFTQE